MSKLPANFEIFRKGTLKWTYRTYIGHVLYMCLKICWKFRRFFRGFRKGSSIRTKWTFHEYLDICGHIWTLHIVVIWPIYGIFSILTRRLALRPGFEPGTNELTARCSAVELSEIGPPGWIRTNDQRIRSPLLYPLSYRRVSVKTTRLTPDLEIAPSHLAHGSESRGAPWRFTLATYSVAPEARDPAALIATSSACTYEDRQEFSVASTLESPLVELTPTPTTLPFFTRTAPCLLARLPNPAAVDSWASCWLSLSHFLGLDINRHLAMIWGLLAKITTLNKVAYSGSKLD